MKKNWKFILVLVLWVILLAFFFAIVEIQIEGDHGWASNLPTWRIEKHWLLDIFWGGRPMTGYHAWVFSFMFLVFHLHFFINGKWTWQLELRTLGCISVFWIVEDFLWFVLNPAYGFSKFCPENISWHKHWFLGFPLDYWMFSIFAGLAIYFSYYFTNKQAKKNKQLDPPQSSSPEAKL